MAQTKEKTKAKKSVAIRVINILFIIALVVAIVVPILMVTPVATSIKATLKDTSWAKDWAAALNSWMKWHVVKVFNLPTTFRGHGVTFTSCLYLYAIYFGTMFSLFMWYLPFVIHHRNKVKGKNQVWRKVVNWTCFGLLTCVFLAVASAFFSGRLIKDFGAAYKWVIDLGAQWCKLFAPAKGSSPKGVLNVLVIERISNNHYAWALIWFYVMLVLFEFICLVVASAGKASKVAEVKEAPTPVAVDEDKVQTPAPIQQPMPVAAAEESKLIPTIREVALLDALNPLYETKIEVLPDIEEKKEEDLSNLRPVNEEALDEAKEIKKVQETAESLSATEDVSVLVLPGIDEWDADPWPEDEQEETNSAEDDRIKKIAESLDSSSVAPILPEEPKNEEKPLEDLTAVAAPEEENVPVEEKPIEEVEEEPSKVVFINDSFKDGLRPQEEDNVKEEIVPEDRTDKKEIVCNNEHKTILTKPVSDEDTWDIGEYHEEPKTIVAENVVVEEKSVEEVKEEPSKVVFINDSFKDGLRPQEEDNIKEEIVSEDRTDKKEIVCNNEHKTILTKPVSDEDTWDIGEYHEEPKPVDTEKPAEPQKPQPRVSQIGLMKFDPSKRKNGPAAPIGVINPVKKDEPVVEEKPVEEKKVAAPIAGPLHSIEKSKHGKIEAVKARHVSFELKNYQVKTYEGDLTAEQAFNMGVTKVQPTVNPVFANQEKGSAWKEKKRLEDIRQNGYGDVVQVEKLTGKTKPSAAPSASSKKPMSIRDMLKAKKNQQVESSNPVEEEKKINKPITPVAFKPLDMKEEPVEEVKKEASPLDQVPSTPFHPIAPLPKKERKRPEIKPIAPINVKKDK